MTVAPKIVKYLFARSGGACAICHREIVFSENEKGHIADMAHIYGERNGAKRYIPEMTDNQRNDEPNLIVLCPSCHRKIDGFESQQWPVERLQAVKREHEIFMQRRLQEIAASEIGYPEIESVLSYLQNLPGTIVQDNFSLIDIKQKIIKNNLSSSTEILLNIGFLRDKDVESFVATHPDPNYSKKLREILIQHYNNHLTQGLEGDYLFEELVSQLSPTVSDFKKRAAALAVIAYFFRICDIFEK